jgi:hypothetical protein
MGNRPVSPLVRMAIDQLAILEPDPMKALIFLQDYIQPLQNKDLSESAFCKVFSIATEISTRPTTNLELRLKQLDEALRGQ